MGAEKPGNTLHSRRRVLLRVAAVQVAEAMISSELSLTRLRESRIYMSEAREGLLPRANMLTACVA